MAENTATTLSGLLKRKYAPKVKNLYPEMAVAQKLIPFDGSAERIGDAFYEPFRLTQEQSFTYGTQTSGAKALASARPGSVVQASVQAHEIVGKFDIAFNIVALTNNGKDAAFAKGVSDVVKSEILSHKRRVETQLWYGSDSLGIVSGVAGSVVTITPASWAAGLWSGQIGAGVDVYTSAGVLRVAGATVTSMDLDDDTRTVTLSNVTGVVGTDTLHWEGEKNNEPKGIHSILTEATTLFGINVSTHDLAKGNSYAVGGAITLKHLDRAGIMAMNKGHSGNFDCFINPRAWADLNTDMAARNRHNTEGAKKATEGFNFINYNSVTGGIIRIIPTPCVKLGNGYMLNTKDWKRIGAQDVQLGGPGDSDDLIQRLPDNSGYRGISYSLQAPYCSQPGRNVVLTGITSV